MTTTCAGVRPLLDLAPLGLLDDEERATLYAHLPACATCRDESSALTAAHATERRALEVEAEPLSPALREALVQECSRGHVAAPADSVDAPIEDSAIRIAPSVEPRADSSIIGAARADSSIVDAPKVETPKVDAPKVETPKVDAPRPVIPLLGPTPVVLPPLDLTRSTLPLRRERRRAPWLIGGAAALVLGGAAALTFDWRQRELRVEHERDEQRRLQHLVDDRLGAADAALARGRVALERGDLPEALDSARLVLAALDELPPDLEAMSTRSEAQQRERTTRGAALVLRAKATMRTDEPDALARAADDLRLVLEGLLPDDLDARRARGELYRHAGKLSEALEELRHVVDQAPGDAEAQLDRARVLTLLESFSDVIPVATQTLERLGAGAPASDPTSDGLRGQLLVLRSRALEATGEVERALLDARAAAALPTADLAAWSHLGSLLMRQGDHFAARDLFAHAIARSDDDERGRVLAARSSALLEAGFLAEALEDARQAVEREPASLLALVVKAEAEEALLHLADALRDAEVATLRAPAREWALQARAERVQARVRATTGKLEAAREHARKANVLDEASSAGRLLLATIELDPSFEDQHLDDAENLFKQVLRRHPRSIEAKRGLGQVALAKYARTPERAQRKLEEAYEEDSRDPWTMSALARVFEDRGASDKARAARARAARFERDPRRPAGYYYLLGVREERRARELEGAPQAQHLDLARDAYRRALFFDPLHAPAHVGLASITRLQGSSAATEAHLKRALAAYPGSTQALALEASRAASRDGRDRDRARAVGDVTLALARRGETLDLLTLQALLTPFEAPGPGETLSTKVQLALARFAELRRRDPWSLTTARLERELIAGAKQALDGDDPLRETILERDDALRHETAALGADLDAREREADGLRREAEALLDAGDVQRALEAAQQAARLAPWRADGWDLLARTRARQGDVWGALAAGVRASHVDDRYAVALFGLLRGASRADGDLAPVIERSVAIDRDALPFEPDLERLLRAAPVVARALVARPELEVGKGTAEQLQELIHHDPTRVAPQLLLGVLAFGADQDELAIQSLLAVATLRADAGEAYYLAALVAASQRDVKQADLVKAVEWLERATVAGFDWSAAARATPRLDALRQSPLWSRLERGR